MSEWPICSDRVRVLRVIGRLNVGGPAIHATLLTRRLEACGYDTMLVAGVAGATEGRYLDLHGDALEQLRIVNDLGREVDLGRDWRAYRALRRIIREFRPHIVHTHTAKAGLIGRLAAWRGGVPVIVHTFHGHVFSGYFSPARTAVIVAIERVLARFATCLLAVSEQVRSEVLARGIGRADRFQVMRLGLNLDPFTRAEVHRGDLRRELGIEPGVRLVGIVARLVPIKAHDVFLAMAARIAQSHDDVAFIIVGDGDARSTLVDTVARLGLVDRVHFLGWRADLDVIYADLDVVVLTSRNEGSPVALTEAMAAARPVVSTDVGGVRELVGDDGLLCAVDDDEGLAEAVARVLSSPAWAADIGRRARERVVSAYSEDRLVTDMAALYERLLPKRPDQ